MRNRIRMVPRAALGVGLVALLSLPAAAVEPVVVYVNQDSGHFWAGLGDAGVGAPDDGDPVPPIGVGEINERRYEVAVDQCHRLLSFSLQYEPENVTVSPRGNSIGLGYTFRVEIRNETLGYSRVMDVPSPGDDFRLGVVPSGATYTLDVRMRSGGDVNWTFSLRGLDVLRFSPSEWEPACAMIRISELEANPPGTDAGHEWLELRNEEFSDVDVSGWTLATLHGEKKSLVLPPNTTIAADGFLVVNFSAGQFLDNVDEAVVLTNRWQVEADRTAFLTDAENDGRTNQWVELPGASFVWTLKEGTPGGAN